MTTAATAKRVLRALDPNDDLSAEPVSPLALLSLLIAAGVSAFFFLRWRIQPMQDLGLHVSMAAIVAGYRDAASGYPAMYKPLDWANTNSLFCTVAGLLGRVLPSAFAFRFAFCGYIVGLPFANLYALRVFGRSAWAAVVAVPLCYGALFAYGFASFLFAGPFVVLAVALFYRMLVHPTKRRVIAVAVVMTLLFLAHWHAYLWCGVLLFAMTLIGVLVTTQRMIFGLPGTRPWTVAGLAILSVLPSLALLGRWAYRMSQPAPADEFTLVRAESANLDSFLEAVKPAQKSLADFWAMIEMTRNDTDSKLFVAAAIVAVGCAGIGRLHRWKRPPVLEIACVLSFASYFLLPEDFAGQQVIASRQIGVGMWFAPALFTPVPWRVTRLGRLFAIVGVVALTSFHLSYWGKLLRKFQKEEAAGLDQVLAAAPPYKRLHYVKIDPDSRYFSGHTFWHVEKWYMLDKRGQVDENPAYGAMQPLRYRREYTPHIIDAHNQHWPKHGEIWENFDLVLVHKWKPNQHDLDLATEKGERLAQHGDWELWQSRVAKR